MTKAFEPSERWLAHERTAAKRWQRNDARKAFVKDTVKWIVVPFAVVAVCWVLVSTLISIIYIAEYLLGVGV